MPQPNWKPPLQDFKAWIQEERVIRSEDTADLEDFIPAGEVKTYLHQPGKPAKVKEILTALFGDNEDPVNPKQVWQRYSIVFAILVDIDQGEYIRSFISHDSLSDTRLPFDKRPSRFPLDQSASDAFFDQFKEVQARFCAPRLSPGHHKFEPNEKLPFLEKVYIDHGGSATVYRVKLHAAHDLLNDLPSSTETRVGAVSDQPDLPKHHKTYALKVYQGEDGELLHGVETATFGKLEKTGLDTAHIIGYHCSFEHRNVRYALLEYADKHTLEDFMMHKDRVPPSLNEEILSFWDNVLSVIVGIRNIHDLDTDGDDTPESDRFTGIHQDIKPKNILLKTKDQASSIYDASFGLADLGTSSLVKAKSRRAPRDNYGTKTYGSPECFRRDSIDDDRNIKITTKADIWSFGCVLSEVCIWVVFGSHGPHGLKSYRQRRADHNLGAARGADCFHLNGQTSQVVLDEHTKVAAQGKCDAVTRAILHLMPKMLHLEPECRPSAKELRDIFVKIMDKAKAGSLGFSSSVCATPKRTGSESTTRSSVPTSPLSPRRVGRPTGSMSRSSNGNLSGSRSIIEGALQTETPRTLTLVDDKHGHADDAVTSATIALTKRLAQNEPTDQSVPDGRDSGTVPPRHKMSLDTGQHDLAAEPRKSAEVVGGRDTQPGHHNESRNQPDTHLSPVAMPAQRSSSPRPSAVVDTPTTSAGRPPRASDSNSRIPPVKLDFKLASKWRREWRNGVKLPDENLFHQLAGRDHVFVIDDCKSMGDIRTACKAKREKEVADYVDVLSYMVKRHDPDGVDLRYFNSAEVIKRCKSSSRLVGSVRGTAFAGLSNPERTLNGLLRPYLEKVRAYEAEVRGFNGHRRTSLFSFTGSPKLPTPLSIYVLTDGVWESPVTPDGGYLEDTLKDLIEGLRAAGCRKGQIGIQFIRFGSHEYGVQRLEALDHLGTKDDMDLDIVDTEPVENGNVWKMLLGAINSRFDAD